MLDRINIFISIMSGIIYTLFSIFAGVSLSVWLPNIIIILILFFMLGTIFKKYIKTTIIKSQSEEELYSEMEEYVNDDENDLNKETNSSTSNIFEDLEDD